MGLPPSAVPPFPVLMARNLRPAGVVVDPGQLWTTSTGLRHAKSVCAHDPVQDHPASQLSGQRRKITTPVHIDHRAQVGCRFFGQKPDVKRSSEN